MQRAFTRKFIIRPIPFIGKLARLIKKFTSPLHFIKFPLTLIHSAILIIKNSISMPHSILFITFILTSLFVSFNNIFSDICLGSDWIFRFYTTIFDMREIIDIRRLMLITACWIGIIIYMRSSIIFNEIVINTVGWKYIIIVSF